jgi:dTDP-4-amino-4,6-dideoxygalactose transaminase
LATFDHYNMAFADLANEGRVRRPIVPQHCHANGHMFYLLLRDIEDRDAFIAQMREDDIATPFHYVPLHSSPAGKKLGRTAGSMAVTDDTSARLVRLPVYYGVMDKTDSVIKAARRYLQQS